MRNITQLTGLRRRQFAGLASKLPADRGMTSSRSMSACQFARLAGG